MKKLIRMYKASNSVLEKANLWAHIEEKVVNMVSIQLLKFLK
mgnify:CR=1 FL=1